MFTVIFCSCVHSAVAFASGSFLLICCPFVNSFIRGCFWNHFIVLWNGTSCINAHPFLIHSLLLTWHQFLAKPCLMRHGRGTKYWEESDTLVPVCWIVVVPLTAGRRSLKEDSYVGHSLMQCQHTAVFNPVGSQRCAWLQLWILIALSLMRSHNDTVSPGRDRALEWDGQPWLIRSKLTHAELPVSHESPQWLIVNAASRVRIPV